MELNIIELNELIYCIGMTRMHGSHLLNNNTIGKLEEKIRQELNRQHIELNEALEPYISDNFTIGPDGAYEADEEFGYVSNAEADEDAVLQRWKNLNPDILTDKNDAMKVFRVTNDFVEVFWVNDNEIEFIPIDEFKIKYPNIKL